ncbi:mCG120675, isoform CRA_a [Mus musculus]|jgi:hypothetical protein|nr:mCG120675, isoform CRA_a [Mus musculus]EDL05042.1 mCG120675, isoform CRA_a [Mus musculus]
MLFTSEHFFKDTLEIALERTKEELLLDWHSAFHRLGGLLSADMGLGLSLYRMSYSVGY